jgi:hypothetical protein
VQEEGRKMKEGDRAKRIIKKEEKGRKRKKK